MSLACSCHSFSHSPLSLSFCCTAPHLIPTSILLSACVSDACPPLPLSLRPSSSSWFIVPVILRRHHSGAESSMPFAGHQQSLCLRGTLLPAGLWILVAIFTLKFDCCREMKAILYHIRRGAQNWIFSLFYSQPGSSPIDRLVNFNPEVISGRICLCVLVVLWALVVNDTDFTVCQISLGSESFTHLPVCATATPLIYDKFW